MSGLISKQLFFGIEPGIAHMCTGGEGPMLRAAIPAVEEFSRLKSLGLPGRQQIIDTYNETKAMLAGYLHTPGGAGDIAFVGSSAEAMNILARGLDWREGDNVVSLQNEYPTSLLPWLALGSRGVSLQVVDWTDDPESGLEAAISDRTRIVCVSHVSYLTGLRLDLKRLSSAARAHGAILAVDASHSLGVIPVPIEHCDFLVSCCYKFMLATHGLGIAYWNRQAIPSLEQLSVGWHSVEWPSLEERNRSYHLKKGADRFELGNPAFISIYVLREALKVLTPIDPAKSEAYVGRLATDLYDRLLELGLSIWTPDDVMRRATNIVFRSLRADELLVELEAHGVRAFSGEGRIRFSLHAFNDEQDIEAAVSAMAELSA